MKDERFHWEIKPYAWGWMLYRVRQYELYGEPAQSETPHRYAPFKWVLRLYHWHTHRKAVRLG